MIARLQCQAARTWIAADNHLDPIAVQRSAGFDMDAAADAADTKAEALARARDLAQAEADASFAAGYARWSKERRGCRLAATLCECESLVHWPAPLRLLVASYTCVAPVLHLVVVSSAAKVSSVHVDLHDVRRVESHAGPAVVIQDYRALVVAGVADVAASTDHCQQRCLMTLHRPGGVFGKTPYCAHLLATRVKGRIGDVGDVGERSSGSDSGGGGDSKSASVCVGWRRLPSPCSDKYRSILVAAAAGRQVLALGDVCERYDLDRGTWHAMTQPVSTPFRRPAGVYWFGRGGDACAWPGNNQATAAATAAAAAAAAAASERGDRVYAFGPEQGYSAGSDVLCYDLKLDRWTRAADMLVQAEKAWCVSLVDRILVADHRACLHEYDPVRDQWKTLDGWDLPLDKDKAHRSLRALGVAYGMLFAVHVRSEHVFVSHCGLPLHAQEGGVAGASAAVGAAATLPSLGDCPGWHTRCTGYRDGEEHADDVYALF